MKSNICGRLRNWQVLWTFSFVSSCTICFDWIVLYFFVQDVTYVADYVQTPTRRTVLHFLFWAWVATSFCQNSCLLLWEDTKFYSHVFSLSNAIMCLTCVSKSDVMELGIFYPIVFYFGTVQNRFASSVGAYLKKQNKMIDVNWSNVYQFH